MSYRKDTYRKLYMDELPNVSEVHQNLRKGYPVFYKAGMNFRSSFLFFFTFHLFYDIIVLVKGCDFYSYVDSKDTDFPIRRRKGTASQYDQAVYKSV